MSEAPGGAAASRVPCAPGPRLPWRLHGRRVGAGAPLVRPGARREGLGRRRSPPPRPAQQRTGVRRLLPGCMLASAWKSRPGSERLVRPQPSGSGGAARARETTAESDGSGHPLPRPAPACRLQCGAARFLCTQRGGGGPAPRARAGGERQRRRRWGAGSDRPAPPQPHPPASAGVGWRARVGGAWASAAIPETPPTFQISRWGAVDSTFCPRNPMMVVVVVVGLL